MEPLDDTAIDALIRAEDERLRQFKLYHQPREERQREYGIALPPSPPPPPPPPERPTLTGARVETLSPDTEETLVWEYNSRYRIQRNSNGEEAGRQRSTLPPPPPPPHYSGPLLTLTTDGPYTRYEVLAVRPPVRPNYEGEQKRKPHSCHYPRPVAPRPQEEKKPQPGESLRRWKYNMGLIDE